MERKGWWKKIRRKKRQATLFVVFISFIFLFTHLFLLDHFVFKSFAGRLFFVPGEERGSKDWGFKKKSKLGLKKCLLNLMTARLLAKSDSTIFVIFL